MLDSVKEAKIGSIIPIYKEVNEEIDALEYFAKLSDYGRKKNSILLETNEKSLGSANPCLAIIGKDNDFEIKALNNLGKKFLNFIKKDFKFCEKAVYAKGRIYGKLTPARKPVSEQERLKLKTHMDIIREIAFKFKPTTKPFMPYCGLFGMISYGFINQVEDLPSNSEDLLKYPDYMLYFLDNMFVVEHKTKKTYFVANALITDKNNERTYTECSKTISNYEKLISKKAPKGKKPKRRELKLSYDTSKDEFLMLIKDLKNHIVNGDILYAAPSKTTITTYNAEPLDIYASLKITGDSAFYMNDSLGISIGAGAATTLNVEGDNEKTVELKISTASKSRDAVKEEIDRDLDNKYEALLRVDENEIAYNIMIADDARNDLARISEPGTRYVDKLFSIDNQNESQNIISSVKGILNKDLDALHAYIATMNAAISGIPKVKSMQLLKNLEKGKRGFNSGSFLYITPDKDLYSMALKPVRIKKDKAYFRTSSRVFHNSSDENEFKASDANALKILNALKSAGGVK